MGTATLVLGGARSGKSRFAQQRVSELSRVPVYVATAEPSDAEMAARIARHRAERGERWRTVEATLSLDERVRAELNGDETVLIDCVSVWLSNELLRHSPELASAQEGTVLPDAAVDIEQELLRAVDRLCGWMSLRRGPTVIVSNEVGSGLVPAYPLGRLYRDILGQANQRLAAACEQVFLVVAGIGVELRRLATAFGEATHDTT